MGHPRIVSAPNGALWVEGQGTRGLGRRLRRDFGRAYARQRGLTDDEIEFAPEAKNIISDRLAARTSYDAGTMTLVEEPEALEKTRTQATAWIAWQTLTDPSNAERFGDLVIQHNRDVFMEQHGPWVVWDRRYAPSIPSPGCDDVAHTMRLLSRGLHVTFTHGVSRSRRFVALDLDRVEHLAAAFEREHADLVDEQRRYGRG